MCCDFLWRMYGGRYAALGLERVIAFISPGSFPFGRPARGGVRRIQGPGL